MDPSGNWFARGARAVRGYLGHGGYLTAVTFVVGLAASLGQKTYAFEKGFVDQFAIGGVDLTPWFAPFVFDMMVAALLHGGLRAARRRLTPWMWWTAGAGVGGLSVATNFAHTGGEITGPASILLFIAWANYMYDEYKIARREQRAEDAQERRVREIEDAKDTEFRSTDAAFEIDPELSEIAYRLARTKDLGIALAYRRDEMGELSTTKRSMVLTAANLYRDLLADRLVVEMEDVSWWQRGARRQALRRAEQAARDNVDLYLGLPVPDRSGLLIPRLGWRTRETLPNPVQAPALAPGNAFAATPAALPVNPPQQELSAPIAAPAQVQRPAGRPQLNAPQARPVPADEPVEVVEPVILERGQPIGPAGFNWVSLDKIPGMPAIDESALCQCHPSDPDKYCGRTLAEHVGRVGKYVVQLAEVIPDWPTREEPIGSGDLKTAGKVGSKGTAMTISYVLRQVRAIARRQDENGGALPAPAGGQAPAGEPDPVRLRVVNG